MACHHRGNAIIIGQGGGVLQLWRWPPVMPHEQAMQAAAQVSARLPAAKAGGIQVQASLCGDVREAGFG